ncbi:hypothetical protein BH09BAC2_BH09BAC2_05880 [soil metagenome]
MASGKGLGLFRQYDKNHVNWQMQQQQGFTAFALRNTML